MTIGALVTGFVGDRLGRRFTYQINLLIFGLASLAAAFAQDMTQLTACRFVQGLGLGAEIVVGYSTLTEFVPPKTRGRWLSMMVLLVVAGFRSGFARLLHYPGLRMATDVRPRRHRLADRLVSAQEPPGIAALARIAGSHGRSRSPDATNREGSRRRRHVAAGGGARRGATGGRHGHAEAAAAATHDRRLLGAGHDQHADLRLRAVPAAILLAPGTDHRQFAGLHAVLSIASLVGCAVGAYVSDAIGRRWSIIGASVVTIISGYIYARFNAASDPTIVLSVGFVLIVAIYVQTAILFGVYTPELFPTEIRLRANGICNTLGRGATVISRSSSAR